MRQKQFTTILFIVLLTILPIISVIMMYHISLCDTMTKMDSGGFGDQIGLYRVSDDTEPEKIVECVEQLSTRTAVYAEQKKEHMTYKAIYFNQYYINFPMKSGRFFQKEDLKAGRCIAVVGKKLEQELYSRQGKSYLALEGMEYQVLGVIGSEKDTVIDRCVYVNMLAADSLVDTRLYTLDIWGEEKNISSHFLKLLQQKDAEAEQLSGEKSYAMSIFPQILYGRWFLWLFLCDLLCILVVSGQWVRLQRQEMAVRRLVGGSTLQMVCLVTGRYLKYAGISISISTVFCVLKFSNYLHALMTGYVAVLPIILVVLVVNVTSTVKTPLAEAIRL